VTVIEFRAPWSASLRTTTVIRIALLVLIVTLVILAQPPTLAMVLVIGLAVLLLAREIAGRVRGYTLTEEAITVHRGLWDTRLPLAGLRSVTGDTDAIRGAIRIGVHGGVFSYTGTFWNRKLGWYRAFVTDPGRTVVLRYPKRAVVISPHDPQHFIMRAGTFIKIAGFPQ